MYSFSHFKLKEVENGSSILLYLDRSWEEYSEEFGISEDLSKGTMEKEATKFIKEKLPNVKEGVVKIMGGAVLVTTFVFGAEENPVEASETEDELSQKTTDAVPVEEMPLNQDVHFDTKAEAIEHVNKIITDSLDMAEILVPGNDIDVLPTVNKLPEFTESVPVIERTKIDKEKDIDEIELEWLAKMIYCEARGESLEGQIAVGAVILNRVKSNQFPSNVKDVVLEQNSGLYQFSPAASGEVYSAKPDTTSIEAARRALSGEDPTKGSLYFYNPDKTDDQWIRSRPVSKVIGNHVFSF